MSWVADAGAQVQVAGITFIVGSTVFYTSLILGVFVVYVFDEPRAARIAISTLRGFLPICANCKSIRDDKGYWNQIEAYIREHSDAEFSHGICPTCAQKLYPNLDLSE